MTKIFNYNLNSALVYMDKIHLDRNNTNFPIQLLEVLRKLMESGEKYDFLFYYQQLLREYFLKVDVGSRGLLAYVAMGLGKTVLANAIAFGLMDTYEPIILLSKSLQENMKGGIAKFMRMKAIHDGDAIDEAAITAFIAEKFTFVSMNASNMIEQMRTATLTSMARELEKRLDRNLKKLAELKDLNGKLLIVDEAHNFFRAITNGSANAVKLYRAIMKSNNVKIVFLTGTPIVNDPYELVPCFNMLGQATNGTLFPEDFEKFKGYFGKGLIENREVLQDRIYGLVSYINHDSQQGKAFGAKGRKAAEFPAELATVVMRLQMDHYQRVQYGLARDRERRESKFGKVVAAAHNVSKPGSDKISSYRVKTRQISNFCSNGPLDSPKLRATLEIMDKHRGQNGLIYSQFVGMTGLGAIELYLKKHGWTEKVARGGKIIKGGRNSKLNEEPDTRDVIDGVEEIDTSAETLDGTYSMISTTFPGKSFAVIKGNVAFEDRQTLQNLYNSPENQHGELLELLLISSTGAEGLDLQNNRWMIIYEPFWNFARIAQVKARGIRANSHVNLPPDERNVQPYILLAIIDEEPSTDEDLYSESVANKIHIDSFLDAIRAVSIECMANGETYCRSCMPNNMPLFGDIAKDIARGTTCQAVESKQVETNEVEHGGISYRWADSTGSVHGVAIYYKDETLGKWRKLAENTPLFKEVRQKIEIGQTDI
jgi:hypothetical protein